MPFHENPKTLQLSRLMHDLPLMLNAETGQWSLPCDGPELPAPSQILHK